MISTVPTNNAMGGQEKIQVMQYCVISMRVLMLTSQTFVHKCFYYQSLQTSKNDAELLILTFLVRLSEFLQRSSVTDCVMWLNTLSFGIIELLRFAGKHQFLLKNESISNLSKVEILVKEFQLGAVILMRIRL